MSVILMYAMYDGTEWKRWTGEAAGAGVGVGAGAILPTLAFGANDEQYIAYYDYVADDLVLLFYNAESQTWQRQTIDAEGDVGTEASIAVGSDNNPRIVYFDNTHDLLKYAWYDGTSWQKTVLDESGILVNNFKNFLLTPQSRNKCSFFLEKFGNKSQ
ncbi:hypothetical protein HZA99_01890 [Candidatus Woesearchaeota archaeon]|nr:hypothetical protein [Candidatus Woesearchaeota archaeon]